MTPENQAKLAAMEKLEQQARIERTRMSPETITLRDRVTEFCRQEKLSQTELARMVGVSPTVVSEVLAEKYAGDAAAVQAKLENVIELASARRLNPSGREFVTTGVAREIFAVLKSMTTVPDMHLAAITGPSGLGKTMALKAALAAEFRTGIYVQANDSCRIPSTLYRALLLAAKVRGLHDKLNPARAFELLETKLSNSRRLIVIDEAENLRMDAINGLRQLHDATGCPVVLVGRPPLISTLRRSVKDDRIGGSLLGRLDLEWDLTARTRDRAGKGGQPLFSQSEVTEMLAKFKVRVAKDALRWLTGLANITALGDEREGCGLRYAISLFAVTVHANRGAALITLEHLLQVNALKQGEEYAGQMVQEVETYIAATA